MDMFLGTLGSSQASRPPWCSAAMVWLESLNRLAYRTSSKAAPAEPPYDVNSNALTTGSSVAGVELVTAFASMLRQASP